MPSSENRKNLEKPLFSAKSLTGIALFAALIAVCSQLSIPLPGGVPMTLQTLVVPLAGILLGARDGTISVLVYLLLGAVGLPVFAGMQGGIGVLFHLTGGFLLSFPAMSFLAGFFAKNNRRLPTAVGLILGTVVNFFCGTLMFSVLSGSGIRAAAGICVLPFLPTAVLKVLLVLFLGPALKKTLLRAGVL